MKPEQVFLKFVKHLAYMITGAIPYIVSAIKNIGATTINFLGLFVALKNIVDSLSEIYKYIVGDTKEKPLVKLNIALLIFYLVYLITFAILIAVGCGTQWVLFISYAALAPIKDTVLTVMYLYITVKKAK